MKPAVITPQTRYMVLQDWKNSKAAYGEPYERWVQVASERYEIPPLKIKAIIAQEAEAFLWQVREKNISESKQVALLAGATVSRAYEVLAEAMNATRRRYLYGRDKKPLIDEETGEHMFAEDPMIAERLRAAEIVIKVNGAFAPQAAEDNSKIIDVDPVEKLTPPQLEEKLSELSDAVRKLARDYRESTPKISGPKPRAAGRRGSQGPVLLDDYLHENEG